MSAMSSLSVPASLPSESTSAMAKSSSEEESSEEEKKRGELIDLPNERELVSKLSLKLEEQRLAKISSSSSEDSVILTKKSEKKKESHLRKSKKFLLESDSSEEEVKKGKKKYASSSEEDSSEEEKKLKRGKKKKDSSDDSSSDSDVKSETKSSKKRKEVSSSSESSSENNDIPGTSRVIPIQRSSTIANKKAAFGVDATEITTHPIHGLSKEQIFDLVQALAKELARIIEDNIRSSYFLTEDVKDYTTQKEEKEKIIYPSCDDCHGSNCPHYSYSYFGICDVCTHHNSKHRYASSEIDRGKILNDIRKFKSKIDEKKKELAKLETLQDIIQTACVQFSLFRLTNRSYFSKIFIDHLLELAAEEKRTAAMERNKYQKELFNIFTISLRSFADTFKERLAKAKSEGYERFVTQKSVAEQILQLTEQKSADMMKGNEVLDIINKKVYREIRKSKKEKKKSKKPKEPNVSDEYATPDEGDDVEIINFLPQEVNIVLLGSTGSGKSTFINSIANMLSHSTLEDAMMDLHVLIRTSFHHISENHEQTHIVIEPTIQVEQQDEADNEDNKFGETRTKHPRSYVFRYGRTNERTLRIIDTPGLGDTRGVEQDRENIRHIINFVSSFREIHAFLFLMRPNDSRLELQFRYCIKELLTHLHVSATNNIIFTFTNGRGTNYKPSETFGTLQALLNSVKEERGVEIQLKDRFLIFDNESYRYLCECQYAVGHKNWEVESYKKSWTHGKKELAKMLEMIVYFDPHDVNNTLSVNKVRRAIEIMARPLAELVKNLLINIQLIQEKEAEIEECLRNKRNFEDRLFTRQIQMRTEELEDPMTVCQHEDCIDRIPLHEGEVEEIAYRKPCHEKCYLQNSEPGEPPGEAIKNCEIFGNINDADMCSVCHHSYQDHLHMRYREVREVTNVLDKTIQEALASTNNKKQVAELFLDAKRTERDALERNLQRKQTICAHFTIFLKDNSVLAYNDQYLAYLNGLIREEREKVNRGANEETLARLESCKEQYNELKKVFDNPANGKKMTLIEIEGLIEEIKRMDDGDLIRDVHSIEIFYPTHKTLDAPAITIKQKAFKHKG